MDNAAVLLGDILGESIDLHRLWIGMVNEILVCHLVDISPWQQMDSVAQETFHNAISNLSELKRMPEELDHLRQLKLKTHELAYALIRELQVSEHVQLEHYRELVDVHTRFLKCARDVERQIWMSYAHEDALTGISNRKIMDSLLDLEWRKVVATGRTGLLVMADIDHFKKVNDTLGHANGDLVLKSVARLIREHTRDSDLVFRYGGEEFLIYMPGFSSTSGMRYIQRLCRQIAQHPIQIDSGSLIHVTVSFGIAEVTSNRPITESIGVADAALYQAKALGRNRVEFG